MKKLIFIVLVANALAPVYADMFQPSHRCYKPRKPFNFTSQFEINSFKRDIETYRECIRRFVKEQNEAVNTHNEAAKKAISEWNNFVDSELN